jgi:hypothetical protein
MDINSFIIGYKKGQTVASPCREQHVVKVTELPDDEAAETSMVYFCDGKYYTFEYVAEEGGTVGKWTEYEPAGGGAELNIAYGDTPPEDTSKLWVKANNVEEMRIIPPALLGANEAATVATDFTIATLGAVLPKGVTAPAAVAVGKKIYVFGGLYGSTASSSLNTINVFDTETKTITTLSTVLPTGTCSMGAAAVGKKIYLFGGKQNPNLNTINVFDTETETITTLSAVLPTATYGIGTAAVGTEIYLFGGYHNAQFYNTINVFDTETKTITTLSTVLPKDTGKIGTAAVGAKIYLFGGTSYSQKINTINVFDTETETITTLSQVLPMKNSEMGTAAVGTEIYLFGGDRSTTINMFSLPSFYLAEKHLLIVASLTDNIFNLLPNVVLGVQEVYRGNVDNEGEKVEAALYKDGEWANI